MAARSCRAIREGGGPCRAAPLRDGDYCLMHSPEHAQEAAEARRLGGLRRRKDVTVTGAYELEGLDGVAALRRLLEIVAVDALSLENSIARGRLLIALVHEGANLLSVGELESRVAELEAAVRPRLQRSR